MKLSIRNQKDFAAGLLYIAAGGAFALGALDYRLGDAARMGPGWFPLYVGILLAAVGVAVLAMSLKADAERERLRPPDLRTVAWIIGAVVLFGLLLLPMGLVVSLAVLIVVASFASHEFRWRGTLVAAAALILFSVGVFIEGINLQIPLWPRFLDN